MRVGDLLRVSKEAKKSLSKEGLGEKLTAIGDELITFDVLSKEIEMNFISHEEIADSASEKLYGVRKSILRCQSRIKDKLSTLISKFSTYLQDPIITMRSGKYVLPVKSECKNSVKGVVHDQSGSGQTVFIEPMAVVEINNELTSLKVEESVEIERILMAYSDEIGNIAEMLFENMELLIKIDVLFAKVEMAISMKASMPILSDEGEIKLINARHPLIDPKKVVPISITLNPQKKCLLITGPNTGGKTVTLKTIGLMALMTKCGMFISADINSKIPYFENVFVDIGDEQSIEQNLSTFSGHIKNIVRTLDKVKGGDLCILDELGAGTDPIEGAGLAIAIVETLMDKNVKVLATTHYSELKAYAIEHKDIENASMEFDFRTLSPTYKIVTGIAGKSNAFLIGEKLGLSKEIIDLAKSKIESKNLSFNRAIESAEYFKQKSIKVKKQSETLKQSNKELNEKLQDLYEKQKKDYDKIIQKAKDKAFEITKDAKEEADSAIKELRKIKFELSRQEESTIRTVKEKLNKVKEEVVEVVEGAPIKEVELGAKVNVSGFGLGEIYSLENSKGEVGVVVGTMKLHVKKNKLTAPTKEQIKDIKKQSPRKISVKTNVQTEIKLIGMNVEEGCMVLDKFLDDAAICSVKEVRIVHGKGTGILRKGVHNFLSRNKHVKEYRLGLYGEGENGVTIATLK